MENGGFPINFHLDTFWLADSTTTYHKPQANNIGGISTVEASTT